MTDYEKGNPAWDIGIVLTRHRDSCEKAVSLRTTAHVRGISPQQRLTQAHAAECTCGAGHSSAEYTTERKAECRQGTSNDSKEPTLR